MKISFPKTNIVGCQFLRYDSTRLRGGPSSCVDEKSAGYRPKSLEVSPSGKVYYYKCIDGVEPQVGDYVVVSCATGYALCQVCETDVLLERSDWAYVISVVDMSSFVAFLEKEKKVARLTKAMKARRAELERSVLYETLAEKDIEMAKMLKELRELGGTI